MNKLKLFVLDLFFPNRCPICNEFITYEKYMCDKCEEKLGDCLSHESSICSICGKNCCNGHEGLYYSRVMSVYFHKETAKEGIISLKGESKNFGYHLGKKLAEKILSDSIMSKADFITYVPMSKKSYKKRRYNQAYVIAKEISEITGIKLLCNVLYKRNSKVQHELNAKERMKNVLSIYSSEINLSGKKIIVCDDVLTTGSTLNRCAKLLKDMNAAEIYGAAGTMTHRINNKDYNRAKTLAEKI